MKTDTLPIESLPHYTYDEYVQWEGRWELIRGIPYAMAPSPLKKHQFLSLEIASQLRQLLLDCKHCQTYQTIDWQDDNPEDTKLSIPPVLVFEILSPSTARKDKILKYQLYQEAGVKYYCIVDPETNSAVVSRLKDSEYGGGEDFQEGKITFDLGPYSIAFDFGDIFRE